MTPTEVLNEIQKLPLAEKQKLFLELNKQLNQTENNDLKTKEIKFVEGLKQKGLVTEMPLCLADDEFRRSFTRIEVKGESLSETLIKERG